MERKNIIIKESFIDKTGKNRVKWHQAGVLFTDNNGNQFGILNVFGSKIKFSAVPHNREYHNRNTNIPQENPSSNQQETVEIIDEEETPDVPF